MSPSFDTSRVRRITDEYTPSLCCLTVSSRQPGRWDPTSFVQPLLLSPFRLLAHTLPLSSRSFRSSRKSSTENESRFTGLEDSDITSGRGESHLQRKQLQGQRWTADHPLSLVSIFQEGKGLHLSLRKQPERRISHSFHPRRVQE